MKAWLAALAFGCGAVHAQGTVNAICSTDPSWCELAAQEFGKATGIRVLQTRKPTGEALAQLRAEAANPKTDLWWGGTGDPFYSPTTSRSSARRRNASGWWTAGGARRSRCRGEAGS